MKNTIIIILVAVIITVAAFTLFKAKQGQKQDPLAPVPTTDPRTAIDDEIYTQMKAVFQSADADKNWDWMADLVLNAYKNEGKSKTEALAGVYGAAFHYFAAGQSRAGEVNGGKGYTVGGGYTAETLGQAINHLKAVYIQKINGL